MRDDFLTADWARHHRETATAIHALIASIGDGLARLNAYQFDAPWRHDADRMDSRCG